MSRWLLISLLCVAGLCRAGTNEGTEQIVYLVRHAEKQTCPDEQDCNPELSAAGLERAQQLAHVLGDAGIEVIYSTDYMRTQQTAAPLAQKLGVPVQLYDPRALPAFAQQLKKRTGRILVVGHSNTTPQLVELLGGEGGAPIDEASEYDRLYLVILGDDAVTTLLQRFGSAAQ